MKIEFVKYLVDEIAKEKADLVRYEKETNDAWANHKATGKSYYECITWKGNIPKKSRIQENCKIARRLLLEIAKEVTKE